MNISSNWSWVPLWTPAVKKASCDLDHNLLITRMQAVGATAFALLSAAFTLQIYVFPFTPFFPVSMGVIASVGVAILVFDKIQSDWAADQKAVNEYLTKPFPSLSATNRILLNFSAAKLLVSEASKKNNLKEILKKQNMNDQNLLDYCEFGSILTSDVFKLLVSNGIDLLDKDRFGVSHFRRIVTSANDNPGRTASERLEWILKERIVVPTDLDKEEQVLCWLGLTDEYTGQLLVEYGFNPSIKSNDTTAAERIKALSDNNRNDSKLKWRLNFLTNYVEEYEKEKKSNDANAS